MEKRLHVTVSHSSFLCIPYWQFLTRKQFVLVPRNCSDAGCRCLCAAAAWCLSKCGCSSWTVISQPSTVSKKKKEEKKSIHMGKADTLQTCTRNWLFYLCEVSSANWVTGVSRVSEFGSLVVLLLCSYGPLGSSCFGARLKQKPCVSSRSGTKHWKSPRSCRGRGGGGTALIWGNLVCCLFLFFFKNSTISFCGFPPYYLTPMFYFPSNRILQNNLYTSISSPVPGQRWPFCECDPRFTLICFSLARLNRQVFFTSLMCTQLQVNSNLKQVLMPNEV